VTRPTCINSSPFDSSCAFLIPTADSPTTRLRPCPSLFHSARSFCSLVESRRPEAFGQHGRSRAGLGLYFLALFSSDVGAAFDAVKGGTGDCPGISRSREKYLRGYSRNSSEQQWHGEPKFPTQRILREAIRH
jgi:hypothetical protein